jgi:hypothetical protein
MDENAQDWADRIGMHISTVFIALLALLFAYGFLKPLLIG